MRQFTLNWIDISIVVVYLLACIVIGYSRSNTVKNLKEYAVGNRSITTIALITSVFATKIGAGATMGEIERVFNIGMIFAISLAFTPLYWFLTAKLFANRIDKFRNCISLTDIMRRLYGKPGQWFTVFASLVDSLGSVAAQLSAIGFLLEYFAGVPYAFGAAFGGILVCTYVTFGGAKSVVLTDIFQFIIFYAVMPIACVMAVRASGGIENVIANLPPKFLEFNLEGENFWRFVTFSFYLFLPATSATFVQRFLMSKNSAQLGYSLYSIALISIPFALILGVIGFTIRSLAPDIQGNHAFYFLVANYLPVGVVGLAISAVFAIIMSSANSWMNSGATIISNDIMRHFKPNMTDIQGLQYARLGTIIITIGSILLAIGGGSIIKILWFSDSFWFPVMLIPMVAGFYGVHSTPKVFAISATTAIIVSASSAYYYGEFSPVCVCLGILGSLAGFVTAQIFSKKANLSSFAHAFHFIRKIRRFDYRSVAENFFSNNRANSLNYITFCIFAIYQYIPSIFNTAVDLSADFEAIIYLQISVIVVALSLFTFESWPAKVRYYFAPILWYFTIFFALAFTPMLLLIVKTDKNLWVINLLLSMILLISFMRISSSVYFLIIGGAVAYLFSGIFQGSNVYSTVDVLETFSPLAYGLIGVFLIYLVKSGFEKRESELSDNAKFVAHEAISPLAIVNMSADTFSKILSEAIPNRKGDKINLPKEDWSILSEVASKLVSSSKAGINRVSSILKSKNNNYSDIRYYQISEIIDEVINEFTPHPITVKYLKSFIFFGSKEALKIVLSNLIRNAIKYAGSKAKISIIISNNNIVVSDNGAGIDPKILPHLFDKKVTTGGHGYGLSLCKQIVEAHGGSIHATSRPKKGTSIEIKFS